MDIVILLVGFSIGLVLLVKGADEMVSSAVQIALKFKLPSSIIGATFIGFGTSAPELFASTGAALKGDLDLGIGNIVGSNIANSLLVVAVLYLALPKDFSQKIKLNQISPVWMAILTTVFVSTYVLTNEGECFHNGIHFAKNDLILVAKKSLSFEPSNFDFAVQRRSSGTIPFPLFSIKPSM